MPVPPPTATEVSQNGGRRLGEGVVAQIGVTRMPKTPKVKWIDVFETGDAEIDALHRELVEDCDRLMTQISNGSAWPLILDATRELVANCIAHFDAEESVLVRMKFPRLQAHLAEHRRMEQEMRRLIASMEEVDGSLREHRDLPASLGPSLIDLIVRHDLDYRSHVQYLLGR